MRLSLDGDVVLVERMLTLTFVVWFAVANCASAHLGNDADGNSRPSKSATQWWWNHPGITGGMIAE